MGDYPDTLAAIIFELNLMMLGIMMFVQWYYAAHNYRLISPRYPASKVQEGLFRNLVIPLLSLAGLILAVAGSHESTMIYLLSPIVVYAVSRHFAGN